MRALVSDYIPLASCKFAKRARIASHDNCLVGADFETLKVWIFENELPYLSLKHEINCGEPILQLAILHGDECDLVVCLLEDSVTVVEIHEGSSHSITTIPIDYVLGHQKRIESDPYMEIYRHDDIDYLLIYRFSGFVTLVNLSLKLETAPIVLRGKRKAPSRKERTFCMGEITVVLMAMLQTQTPVLAVLYRDVDFYYSLRYYDVSMSAIILEISRQMEIFKGAPTHIYAALGGVVVMSDSKVWYFPPPHLSASVENEAGDSIHPVSINYKENVVTLNYSALSARFLGSKITCSTSIDKYRQLVVTDKGDSILLYLQTRRSFSTIEVGAFKVVPLLRCTIASTITHIDENVFFASSAVSRSILFRIIPRAPFIDILQTLTNNSPILSVDSFSAGYSTSTVVARGGFNSGEIHVLPSPCITASHCESVQVRSDIDSLELEEGDTVTVVKMFAGKTHTQNQHFPTHAHLHVDASQEFASEKVKADRWEINEQESLTLVDRTPVTLQYKGTSTHSIELPGFDQISDLLWQSGDMLDIFACLWNGKMVQIRISSTAAEIVHLLDLPYDGKTHLGKVDTEKDSYIIMALNSNGALFQAIYTSSEFTGSTCRKTKTADGSFRLSVNREIGYSSILVFDRCNIFQLVKPELCAFLEPRQILSTKEPVLDCKYNSKQRNLFVLFSNGVLSHFHIDLKQHPVSYFSDKLVKSVIRVTKRYFVCLEIDHKANEATGSIDLRSQLKVLDAATLSVLDVYEAKDTENFIDVFRLPNSDSEDDILRIVAINSGSSTDQLLLVFRIEEGRFLAPHYYPMNGFFPVSTSILSATRFKDRFVLVGTSTIDLRLIKTADSFAWEGASMNDFEGLFIGVDAGINSEITVLADANRGIHLVKIAEKTHGLLQLQYPPALLSSLKVFKKKNIIVYGDSIGNVGAIRIAQGESAASLPFDHCKSVEQLFAANIDEPVNTITVICELPISLLVGTSSGRILKFQQVSGTFRNKSHRLSDLRLRPWVALCADDPQGNQAPFNCYDAKFLDTQESSFKFKRTFSEFHRQF